MNKSYESCQGKRLKEIRIQNRISQRELADFLHVCQSTYAKYERGKTLLPIDFLPKIAAYFDVDPNYLLGVINYPFPYPKSSSIMNRY